MCGILHSIALSEQEHFSTYPLGCNLKGLPMVQVWGLRAKTKHLIPLHNHSTHTMSRSPMLREWSSMLLEDIDTLHEAVCNACP